MDRAPSMSGSETGYAPTYYPNVTGQSMAAPIDVQEGSELRGIDIHLVAIRVFHVRGKSQRRPGDSSGLWLWWRERIRRKYAQAILALKLPGSSLRAAATLTDLSKSESDHYEIL